MTIRWHPEKKVIAVVKSINNFNIRLTEERWLHIIEYHKELEDFQSEILLTIVEPDIVYSSPMDVEPNLAAVKEITSLVDKGLAKNLVVHYKEPLLASGFILTAFVMSDKKLKKRFKLWRRLK
jgi:hypothetical protein